MSLINTVFYFNRLRDMATTAHCQPEGREWTDNRRFEPYSCYRDDVELDLIQVPSREKDWIHVACEGNHPCSNCQRICCLYCAGMLSNDVD